MTGIGIVYMVGLFVWGAYLAFRVRKVPIAAYDESKVIAPSIYITAVFAGVVIVIQWAIGNSNRDLTFMITVVCSLLGGNVTTACLFVSKLWAIHRFIEKSGSTATTRTSSRSTGSHNHSRPHYSGGTPSPHSNNSAHDDTAVPMSKVTSARARRSKQKETVDPVDIQTKIKKLRSRLQVLEDTLAKQCATSGVEGGKEDVNEE